MARLYSFKAGAKRRIHHCTSPGHRTDTFRTSSGFTTGRSGRSSAPSEPTGVRPFGVKSVTDEPSWSDGDVTSDGAIDSPLTV